MTWRLRLVQWLLNQERRRLAQQIGPRFDAGLSLKIDAVEAAQDALSQPPAAHSEMEPVARILPRVLRIVESRP